MAPFGAGAGDGGKRNVLEQPGFAAKTLQRLDRVDFGQLPARRLAVEPGEEARHGRAIALLRGARAGDLDRRSSPPSSARSDRCRARPCRRSRRRGARSPPGRRLGRGARPRRALPSAARSRSKSAGARTSASASRRWRTSLPSLRGIDIKRRPAFPRHDGEGERDAACAATSLPRMLKVQATACGSETTSASALSLLDLGADARELVAAASSPA